MKLLAIDGNSLMHRAFHALPLLTNTKGAHTNAVYGFLRMLLRLLEQYRPDYVAVAFDMHGPTFRHAVYPDYKAGRAATPEELREQFPMLKTVLKAMGIAALEREGYEADDILGYLAKCAREKGLEAYLVTGDRDALQLVGEGVEVIFTKKGISDTDILDAEAVRALLGVDPAHVPDLKGLMGDHSDNIPGIPGVGPKTARTLLEMYGDLEHVLENAQGYGGPKLREALQTYAEQARMSRRLATIDSAIPDGMDLEEIRFAFPSREQVAAVFQEMEFTSLLKQFQPRDAQAAQTREVERERVDTLEALRALVDTPDRIAVHFEEEGVSIALNPHRQYDIALSQTLLQEGLDARDVLAVLADAKNLLLFDKKKRMHRLAEYGLHWGGDVQDALLAAYVCDPAQGQDSFAALCEKYGLEACGAASLYGLFERLSDVLRENGMWRLYHDLELPLADVLFAMEQTGFHVDVPALREMSAQYAREIAAMEQEIYGLCGMQFNINSTKQLASVLFEHLGLKAGKKTKNGYSTDIGVLEQLAGAHPVVPKLIAYRKATKLKSTYLDGLVKVADRQGVIHTTFTQNVTATGRISSLNPNLQNIPVRTAEGREIRRVFIPSDGSRVLIAADYSQIELRILAHMAGDADMIAVFNRGGDIHTDTAAEVFGVARELVSPQMRAAAKAVNFGIVYGISDFGLANQLGIPVPEAARYIAAYFGKFQKVRAFMDGCVAFGREHGYVQTLWGRRRYLPELQSRNYNIRAFGERVAMNAPIQGTAADIIKAAMLKVHRELQQRHPDARLILQVHDELIVDCPGGEAQPVAALVTACMEGIVPLSVPLKADTGVGRHWLEAK